MIKTNKSTNKRLTCNGCIYFYITYKKERPWGCKKFGFISKFSPATEVFNTCLLYTSPSPRDKRQSRMPSSA